VIVLDASAAIELLINSERGAAVREAVGSDHMHAPHLLDIEVAQVLRRFRLADVLTDDDMALAIEDLIQLRIRRHAHLPLLPRIRELCANATAYDACYLALAEDLGATLVTCDKKMDRVPGCAARIQVVS
jgi:predicted nucleic acid-binding protein